MPSQEEYDACRKALVDALRSGDYKQGQKRLRSTLKGETLDCCLGVACDLSGLGKWENRGSTSAENRVSEIDWFYVVTDDEESNSNAVLPEAVRSYYGFVREDGGFGAVEGQVGDSSLAGMNDAGATFAMIADIIEAEPPGMFVS